MKARAERFGVPLASKPDAKPTTAAVPKSKTAPKALAKAPLSVSVGCLNLIFEIFNSDLICKLQYLKFVGG